VTAALGILVIALIVAIILEICDRWPE